MPVVGGNSVHHLVDTDPGRQAAWRPGTAPFKSRLGLNDLRRYCLLFLETDLPRRVTLATLAQGASSRYKAKVGNFFTQGSCQVDLMVLLLHEDLPDLFG